MNTLFFWKKDRIIPVGVLFLYIFIPLYPKLPLIHVIRTWVYIRLEDFLVAGLIIVFLFIAWRDKWRPFSTPLTKPIFLYWIIGLASVIFSLLFIGPKLWGYFPHLVVLHYLRRIEYMMLFFAAAAMVKSTKSIYIFVALFVVTVFFVDLYGLGQKFLGFPAFLTMNEEFAKGLPLFLSATSRITSTFAGHYDLAAYAVFAIAILGSLYFGVRNIFSKLIILFLTILTFVILLFTTSRVSFIAYVVVVSTMLWLQKKKLLIVPVIVLSIFLLVHVTNASDRFAKTLRLRQVLYDANSGKPVAIMTAGSSGQLIVEKRNSPAEENLPIGSEFINVPIVQKTPPITKPQATPPSQSGTLVPSDRQAVAIATSAPAKKDAGKGLAIAPEQKISFYSAEKPATESGGATVTPQRFVVQNALVYDISFTTRLQGQWPKAWEAFQRNILLGSGFSTLSVASDSDYLRALGETGVLGFLSFFSIFFVYFIFTHRVVSSASPFLRSLVIGTQAGLVGLLLNAIFIDIFEASKVAFPLWMTLGITIGGLRLTNGEKFSFWREAKKIITPHGTYDHS